jgi:hypothetical protein
MTIVNGTFLTNSASTAGAIRNSSMLRVYTSTLADNTATSLGGAVDNNGTLVVSNTNLVRNAAGSGGAIAQVSNGPVIVLTIAAHRT